MTTYIHVICSLRPGAQVALVGGQSYENIDWGGETPIPQAELDAAMPGVSLDRAKLAKRAEINRARDAAEAAGFTYLGKPFDSNAQAIKRLYGAAMAAQSAIAGGAVATDPFVDWTCADGTVLTMTYAQTAGVIAAMASVGNALHIKARTLKAQIEAATTVEEVSAIQW